MKIFSQLTIAIALLFATLTPAHADGVLVFGGTGRLGAEIVKQLINAGETNVTVFARPTSDRNRLEGLAVSYVTGNALSEADVEAALKSNDFRTVYNALAGRMNGSETNFYEKTQVNITKWAKETGVKRVILNSSVGAGDSIAVYPKERLAQRGKVLKDKEYAENNLMSSGLEYTIIRNRRILPETTPVSGVAYLTDDQTATGAIGRADLGVLNVYCLDSAHCENNIFHALIRD